MVISNQTNRVSFAGDGSSTVFAYPYWVRSVDDLTVLIVDASGTETTQIKTTHYSFSGTLDGSVYPSGGNVTMVSAPASGETLIIFRDPMLTQVLDLVDNDEFPAQSVEDSIDLLMAVAIRTRELIGQTFRVTDGQGQQAEIVTQPNSVLGTDGDGDLALVSQIAMRVQRYDASATLAVADMTNTAIELDTATSSQVLTIPTNASVTSGTTTAVIITNTGTASWSITAASGVTLNGTNAGSVTLAQYAAFLLWCPSTVDEWFALGNYT